MSYRMKFGWFTIKNILFYDEEERKIFEEKVKRDLGEYLRKISGKRVIGRGVFGLLTKEERQNLNYLNAYLDIDEKTNTARLGGYGHRRIVMPIEMWVRKQFDEGRIVSYDAADGLWRESDYDYFNMEAINDEVEEFYKECRRRLELYKKGELEPPAYRQETHNKVK